jgi:hypothetical protein
MELTVRYPVAQTGFDVNNVDNSIKDYRATRILLLDGDSAAVQTIWQFQERTYLKQDGQPAVDELQFTVRTGVNSTASGSILAAGIDYIDMWFPPSQDIIARAKQHLSDGNETAWTDWLEFVSLGPLNSYQAYQIMKRVATTSDDMPDYGGHSPGNITPDFGDPFPTP